MSRPFCLIMGMICLLHLPLHIKSQNPGGDKQPAAMPDTGLRIQEERFIEINGIKQWVTLRGDRSKPVILFLHGGPGSPMSPSAASMYKNWEKDFLLVQWDQRGSGRTYGINAPAELTPAYLKANPLTVSQMTTDGIELTGYLIHWLGKQKIILFGTSWGSVLGVSMAVQRPDLFYAYVGHSQVVNPYGNLSLSYNKVNRMTKEAGDQSSQEILTQLGPPPYDTAKNSGKLFRIIKKYERLHSRPAPDSLWIPEDSYDNKTDEQNRSDGDDYSFVNYVGDKRLGVQPMMATVDLFKDGLDFKIPVYLIQGEEDILTPKEITSVYFNKIRAPQKEYFLLPETAHGFNMAVLETQYKIMKRISKQIYAEGK